MGGEIGSRGKREGTHVAQLAHDFPYAALIQARYEPAVLLEKEGKVAELTELGLDEELPVLLPGVDKGDDMVVGRRREAAEDVHLLEVSQPETEDKAKPSGQPQLRKARDLGTQGE